MSEVSALALVREKGEVEPRVGRGGEREAIVVFLDGRILISGGERGGGVRMQRGLRRRWCSYAMVGGLVRVLWLSRRRSGRHGLVLGEGETHD